MILVKKNDYARWNRESYVMNSYPTPIQAGSVRIVAEQNSRLTLVSTDNTTFYFDVPALQYVSSLTEVAPTFEFPTVTPTPTEFPSATPLPPFSTLYLRVTGANLFLSGTAPTNANAQFKDSPSVQFSNGNPWKEVGTWAAAPSLAAGHLAALHDLHGWLGLKNNDDIGTSFDLRAELYRNGEFITSGTSDCISDLTRNAAQAKEVTILFDAPSDVNFDGAADVLSLKIFTRIGTDGVGNFCGGHSNAVGLRLYFDGISRPARFELALGP